MRKFAWLLVWLMWAGVAHANVPCSLPFNLLNGTVADATQVMANYNAIVTCLQNAAASGANNDITSLSALTTPLTPAQGGSPVYVGGTSTGSGSAQSVTISAPTGYALTAGNMVVFKAGAANSGPMTLAVNGTTATNVFVAKAQGGPAAMNGNEIQAGQVILVEYDGTEYQLLTPSPAFTLNSLSGPLTVGPTNCGQTLQFAPTAQIAVSFPAVNTLGNCVVRIVHSGSWSTPAGIQLSIPGFVTNPPVLYPGMAVTIYALNGSAYFQNPNIAQVLAPLGTRLFLSISGNDGNDCLSNATPCHSLNYLFGELMRYNLMATTGSATGGTPGFDIRLLSNASCIPSTGLNCFLGLHWSPPLLGVEGHNSVMIECDAGTATNCTIADSTGSQAIGVYCACHLEMQNVTLAGGSGNNNLIQAEMGMVRLEGGMVFNATGSGSIPQIQAIFDGSIVVEGSTTLTVQGGTSGALAGVSQNGNLQLDQAHITFAAATTYSQSTLQALGGFISAVGTVWSNPGNVTAANNIQCQLGGFAIVGGVATVPGTNTQSGCTNSGNGQAN